MRAERGGVPQNVANSTRFSGLRCFVAPRPAIVAPMGTPNRCRISLAVAVASAALLLGGCVAEDAAPTPGASVPAPTASETKTPSAATPTPTLEPEVKPDAAPALPSDCAAMFNADVTAQLAGVPLNDPAFGATGLIADGNLLCIWADPGADTTGITTQIVYKSEGSALDYLNELLNGDGGYTCYEATGGVRCEATWQNASFPVTDGRTLFYRGGVLIDSSWSNLAPAGYTDSIITYLFG